MHRVAVAGALLLTLSITSLAAHDLNRRRAGWDGLIVLVEALADRFGPIEREAGFEALRPKLARSGLVPSLIFDDAAAWTMRGGDWRAFDLAGYASGGVYHIGIRAEAPRPSVRGQYKGTVKLQRLAAGRFEWTASDDLAIGQARPWDVAGALDTLLHFAERSTEASARAAIAKVLPRASAQFGLLFRLETVSLRPDAQGATSVRLAVRLTPAGIGGFAPRHAAFLEKHAEPVKVSLIIADPAGVTWWTLEATDGLWTVRLRIKDGSLVPLEGLADRGLAGRLRARADVATRIGRFEVGARRLTADLTLTRTPGVKGLLGPASRGAGLAPAVPRRDVSRQPSALPVRNPGFGSRMGGPGITARQLPDQTVSRPCARDLDPPLAGRQGGRSGWGFPARG